MKFIHVCRWTLYYISRLFSLSESTTRLSCYFIPFTNICHMYICIFIQVAVYIIKFNRIMCHPFLYYQVNLHVLTNDGIWNFVIIMDHISASMSLTGSCKICKIILICALYICEFQTSNCLTVCNFYKILGKC